MVMPFLCASKGRLISERAQQCVSVHGNGDLCEGDFVFTCFVDIVPPQLATNRPVGLAIVDPTDDQTQVTGR